MSADRRCGHGLGERERQMRVEKERDVDPVGLQLNRSIFNKSFIAIRSLRSDVIAT
jgi:hypothetical protein